MNFCKPILSILLSAFCLCASSQINTEQVLNVGRNALYFEDYVLSIQYFNQVIAAKPYLAQPFFFRALAKYNLDDLHGALADVTTALERNPFITDAYELRGVIYQNLGQHREALDDYNAALSMLPENRSLLFNKAVALMEMKDYEAADSAFNAVINRYPRFENGYLGQAQLMLAKADTITAISKIDKALELNPNLINAHILRSEIMMGKGQDSYAEAIKNMDEAIKLNPKEAGFFINRAFLRYKLDDYFGAMSDYDYAIQLEPENFVAHYNRALLCCEVKDYDKALDDFNEVIRLKPDEYRTLFNRATVYRERKEYRAALKDINKVIEAFPTLAAAYFMRFDIKHALNDRTAKADLDKSLALAKQRIKVKGKDKASDVSDLFGTPTVNDNIASSTTDDTEPQEVVAARFSALLTVKDNMKVDQEYNNKSIRGKVQDRNISIEMEPLFTLSYFISPTDLKPTSDFIRELDDINRTRALRFLLLATNHEPELNDENDINRHFQSIEYYNSYIATHTPRAIDYFGRGMDQFTVHNYEAAKADFSKAIELTPDFALAYFMRGLSNHRISKLPANEADGGKINMLSGVRGKQNTVLSDFDKVIQLSPNMAAAHFNKGTLLLEYDDITSAISSLNKAIELKPDFGEAYYNRGYAYLKLGNKHAGLADLSKAGELGIAPSYQLLKRMGR